MDREIWVNFVEAGYHDEAPGYPCGNCNAGGENNAGDVGNKCKRFFCVPCKEGSLCKKEFVEGRPHFQHDLSDGLLQVYKTSGDCTVRQVDLRKVDNSSFLDTSVVMEFQNNHHVVYYLSARDATPKPSPIYCHGCRKSVANAKLAPQRERNTESAKVCSIQCLLEYQHPIENYRDGYLRKQLDPC